MTKKIILISTALVTIVVALYFIYPGFVNANRFDPVLAHYSQHPEDSLKLRAAQFLIDNMDGHFGVPNYLVDARGNRVADFDSRPLTDVDSIQMKLSALGYHFEQEKPVVDNESVTPEFLIENIDLAFQVWPKPWNKHLSFEEFCEWILPYRCQNEPLSRWRKQYYDRYRWILDSVPDPQSYLDVCVRAFYELQKETSFSDYSGKIYSGYLDPFEMEKIRIGDCRSLAVYSVLAMRALGIPVSYLEIPYWSVDNSGHAITVLKTDNPNKPYCEFDIQSNPPDTIPHTDFFATVRQLLHTFAPQQDFTDILSGVNEPFPPGLFNPFARDFIAYPHSVDSLIIPVAEKTDRQLLYLCTFNSGDWRPFMASRVENGMCRFYPVTRTLLYALGKFENDKITILGNPFIFQSRDSVFEKNASSELTTITLPFDLLETDIALTRLQKAYYWKSGRWMPMKGVAYMSKRKIDWRKKGLEDKDIWEPPLTSYTPGEQKVFYLATFKNVPKNTVYHAGGTNRLYTAKNSGWYVKH